MSINVDQPPRCAVCHRDAHRSGWQGHYYVAPQPFLAELTNTERTTLFLKLGDATKAYNRLAGYLLDSVNSWLYPQARAAFDSIMAAYGELNDLRDHLNSLPAA